MAKQPVSRKNPFMIEQYIDVILVNKNNTSVDINSIPTGDEIITNPKIYDIKTSYFVNAKKKYSTFIDKDIRKVKMKLNTVALKLLLYISETIESNTDYFNLTGVKMKNFMDEAEIKSRSTVYAGVQDLCRYGFITPDAKRGYYWINPHRFFKGNELTKYKDRLRIVNK